MYLSYSGFKNFEECPRAYWHRYVDKTILPEPDNRVNMLYGSVIGVIFERFYNDRIWSQPNSEATLQGLVEETLTDVMKRETAKGGVFNWKAPKLKTKSRDAVVKEVRDAIPRGLNTIRLHRLVGRGAAAEVKLDGKFNGHIIGGRADFILRRVPPHNDLVILDGKGSRYREQYVDAAQLRWYGMLYEAMFGEPPDKLGFVFWRQDPESALDWVPFTPTELIEIKDQALEAIDAIEKGSARWRVIKEDPDAMAQLHYLFPPAPSGQCKMCSYQCPLGKSLSTDKFIVPQYDGVGVEDIGLEL